MLRFVLTSAFILTFTILACAQEPRAIQDNSFLVEEAYNQEAGVVQEISFFTRSATTHSWVYSFTNEWPVNGIRHQFSYTVSGTHNGEIPGSAKGYGDTALNYRYQLVGNGETRIASSPRFTVLLPTGDSRFGRGFGGTGLQTELPVSIVLHPKLVTHFNTGATWVPNARNELNQTAGLTGYNVGQSLIWLARPRFNVMLEVMFNDMQSVVAQGKTAWQKDLLISPGVRWAHNFKSGLQIVPGVAFPMGAGPSAGDRGVILYLSFEQPLKMLGRQTK